MDRQTHKYGEQIHLLKSSVHSFMLQKFCTQESVGRDLYFFLEELYRPLFYEALNDHGAFVPWRSSTRMDTPNLSALVDGQAPSKKHPWIFVNLARAGTAPSHLLYTLSLGLIPQEHVRQDHIYINRTTNPSGEVTGVHRSGVKIGGPPDDALLFIADPMGATGQTMGHVYKHYESLEKSGPFHRFIALHLIVTPEYLRHVRKHCPKMEVYALRVDRGLSSAEVLKRTPGECWEEEKGLTPHGYIVPGAGGIGEILNNSFV